MTAPKPEAPTLEELPPDVEALIETLRGFGRAYPEDIFGPVTEQETKDHASLITRNSAAMGRHCAKFMVKAADMIESQAERLRAIENAKGVPERQLAEAIADVEKLREEKRNMWERGIILENQLAELQRKHDGLVARLREPSVEMIEAGKKVFIDFPANGHLYQEIRLIHKAMSTIALREAE